MRDRSLAEIVRNQRPLSMRPEATVAQACEAMHQRRVGAVLVTDENDRLLGIFTGRDAIRCLAQASDARRACLRDAMTQDPVALGPGQSAMDALRLLDNAGFRHLPICHEGRACGIVSRYDFRAMEHAKLDEETGFFEVLR